MREETAGAHERRGGELKSRRQPEGLNLALLDIMACGLGAVILVFMLVKFEDGPSIPEQDLLKADLERLQAATQDMDADIAALQARNRDAGGGIDDAAQEIEALQARIAAIESETTQREQALASLRTELEAQAQAPAEPQDVIPTKAGGEEDYLIGLTVTGPRIGILLDASASMTDFQLIDIIRAKGAADSVRRQRPKWRRALATLEWLLARLPEESQVTVIAFAEKATPLVAASWTMAWDGRGLGALLRAAADLTPAGGTNLEAGLVAMNARNPSNLYIITDGLPTMAPSGMGGAAGLAYCSGLRRGAAKVSGACRQHLFAATVQQHSPPGDVPVNVILLPLEGDAGAAGFFWNWAAASGGLMISPAAGWP